jgi:predicted outer membrane lipoprotein
MYSLSINKAVVVGLLVSAPLAAAFGISDAVEFEKRHVVSHPDPFVCGTG